MAKQKYTFKQKSIIYEELSNIITRLENESSSYREYEADWRTEKADTLDLIIDIICGLEI